MDPYAPLPRAVAIAARTAHLLAMAGYLGGRLAGRRQHATRWRLATTLTGAALLATEASHSRDWPCEGRGLLAFLHVGILPLGHVHERAGTPAAVAALLVGAIGSHLPRAIRTWSLRYRRVVADGPSGRRRDQVHAGRVEHGVNAHPRREVQLAD